MTGPEGSSREPALNAGMSDAYALTGVRFGGSESPRRSLREQNLGVVSLYFLPLSPEEDEDRRANRSSKKSARAALGLASVRLRWLHSETLSALERK